MTGGPFIHAGQTNRRIMVSVLVGLAPAAIAAVWRHGTAGALLLGAAVAGAWAAEWLLARAQATDGSALVTGVIFALTLPPSCPAWLALAGGALAIAVGKHAFGGLGRNPFNPAALSRAVLMGLLPAYLFAPAWVADGITAATPLAKESGQVGPTLAAMLAGGPPGALAQAAPLAVLAGGLLLIALRALDWRLPLWYLAGIAFFALVLPPGSAMAGHAPWLVGNPLMHLLAGGSLMTAFFLITDPVTAPFSPGGRIVFALLAAGFTMAVRFYTPYPDGAVLGVLLANAAVPLIDRHALGLGPPGRPAG